VITDKIVNVQGQDITIVQRTSTGLDDYDEPNIVETQIHVKAYLSSRTEKEAIRVEGRFGKFDLKATIPHDTDVMVARSGGNDHVIINDELFKVVGIDDVRHPLSRQEKRLLYLLRLPGRDTPDEL